jgi:hypothetical protein
MPERRRIGATLGTALLLALGLHAAEPPSAARVAALIAELGSSRHEQREAATRALEAVGAPALGPLREARQHDDAEVRRRARLLVQTIERRTEAERLLQPGRVRLVYRDTPLRLALADFVRKTGFAVRLEGDGSRPLTLDTGDTTVWDAVAQFCRQAGVTERPAAAGPLDLSQYDPWDRRVIDLDDLRDAARREQPLVFQEEASPPLPTFQKGALRLRALPPDALPAGQARVAGETRFGLEVRLEPRLRLQAVLGLRVDRAVDERGRVLTQPAAAIAGAGALAGGPGEEILLAWDGESALPADLPGATGPVTVRLRRAGQPSQRLKELRGVLALQVQGPEEPLVTVDDLRPGRAVQGGDGSTVQVIALRREAGGAVRLRVEVAPAARALFVAGVPARMLLITGGRWRGRGVPVPPPVRAGQLTLFDERGRKVPLVSSTVPAVGSGGTAWDFTLVYRPAAGQGEPARLVYTGRRAATVEVAFTLEDVPLP